MSVEYFYEYDVINTDTGFILSGKSVNGIRVTDDIVDMDFKRGICMDTQSNIYIVNTKYVNEWNRLINYSKQYHSFELGLIPGKIEYPSHINVKGEHKLPNEIWAHIIAYLGKKDLYNYMLTSKEKCDLVRYMYLTTKNVNKIWLNTMRKHKYDGCIYLLKNHIRMSDGFLDIMSVISEIYAMKTLKKENYRIISIKYVNYVEQLVSNKLISIDHAIILIYRASDNGLCSLANELYKVIYPLIESKLSNVFKNMISRMMKSKAGASEIYEVINGYEINDIELRRDIFTYGLYNTRFCISALFVNSIDIKYLTDVVNRMKQIKKILALKWILKNMEVPQIIYENVLLWLIRKQYINNFRQITDILIHIIHKLSMETRKKILQSICSKNDDLEGIYELKKIMNENIQQVNSL
jgi:hypothetical protein